MFYHKIKNYYKNLIWNKKKKKLIYSNYLYKPNNLNKKLHWFSKVININKILKRINIKFILFKILKNYKPIYNTKILLKKKLDKIIKNKKKKKKKTFIKNSILIKRKKQYNKILQLISFTLKKKRGNIKKNIKNEITSLIFEKKNKTLSLLQLFNNQMFFNKRFDWKKK